MRQRLVVWTVLVLAAGAARGQQDGQQGDGAPPSGAAQPPAAPGSGAARDGQEQRRVSDAFDRACMDLLHGRMPEGDQAIKALREACENLMSARTDERIRQEQRLRIERQIQAEQQAKVQPGQATAAPQQGEGVLAAFGQAGSELVNPRGRARELGMRPRGPIAYSIVTNPVGWFTGIGVNAVLSRTIDEFPKLSWVAGARYSTTDATNGSASTFGALGGADFYIIGRRNEGLRIGPRLEVAAGREDVGGPSTTFARLGMSGEIGYNFVASNGITGQLGGGVGGRVAGNSKNDEFSSFVGGEFGPYLNVGLGYSW